MFTSWAVLRISTADTADRWTIPQLVPAVLHLVVAVLFFNRNPWTHQGNVASIVCALPSFLTGGLAINMAPAPHQWHSFAQWLLAIGATGAVTGMFFLGRSFAIFPAIRPIVTRGVFQWIRHPIYFFELVMIAACCAAGGSALHWGIFLASVAAIVIRIFWEEKTLVKSVDYVAYSQSVRFRLIPGFW